MKFFQVASGNWKKNVRASSCMEAATVAVEQIFKSRKRNYTFGALISVWEMKHKKLGREDKQMFLYAPLILANAGEYGSSRQLQKNIDHYNFFN